MLVSFELVPSPPPLPLRLSQRHRVRNNITLSAQGNFVRGFSPCNLLALQAVECEYEFRPRLCPCPFCDLHLPPSQPCHSAPFVSNMTDIFMPLFLPTLCFFPEKNSTVQAQPQIACICSCLQLITLCSCCLHVSLCSVERQ